jgi:hypothetical protein
LEKQVVGRLRELEPALAEYQELRQIAERLGLDYDPSGEAARGSERRPRRQRGSSTPPRRPAARPRTTKRRTPVAAGKRDEQVLAAVVERPGITVPELGQALNVDYTGLYRVVRRLEAKGEIRKSGARLERAGK